SASPGIPYGAITGGIAAGVLGAVITLVFIYGYYRFIEAPSDLYLKTYRQLINVQQALDEERAKNAEPRLVGRIDWLNSEPGWDCERYGMDEENRVLLKVCFTLNVTLWNQSAAATTVSGFTLDVLWAGRKFHSDTLPVDGYSARRGVPRSRFDEW